MKIIKPSVSLEFITPDAMQLIEKIGRTCYKSEDRITPKSAEKFVKMILERGHKSVVEHAHASFRVICDRGVSHEFVRHRIFSYSQESTRYCNYSKEKFNNEISVIEPPGLTDSQHVCWACAVLACENEYIHLIEKGAKPEIARSVLPTCLKTELVGTANFREWLYFLEMRASAKAHPQMREIAYNIGVILHTQYPVIFPVDYTEELTRLLVSGDFRGSTS